MTRSQRFTVGGGDPGPVNVLAPDQRRHREKIEQAIRHNLADMVAEEHVLVTRGERRFATRIEHLKECRIRYDAHQGTWASLGWPEGQNRPEGGPENESSGRGVGGGGAEAAFGEEETPVLLEDLSQAVFSYLALPDLDPERMAKGEGWTGALGEFGRKGTRWAKRQTLWANLTKNAYLGQPRIKDLAPEDLRFWQWSDAPQPGGGAVVMALMDTSGSMGNFEKYLAKSFFFWTAEFLRQLYPSVDLVFIAHDVRAREVDEDTFFHRGASGGTVSSSAYLLAYQILEERYSQEQYNAYAFHFSDGGNLTSDNPTALASAMRLQERVNLFGYGEIHDTDRSPSQLYQALHKQGRRAVLLRSKEDVLGALVEFFGAADPRFETALKDKKER